MTQSVPTPVLPLQYDNTRPETLLVIVRLFCYAQIAGSILVLIRIGIQFASGRLARAGFPAGLFLTIVQVVAYSIGPFISNALLLIASLLALQLNQTALTYARLYCVAAWVSYAFYLLFVPWTTWSFFTAPNTLASPQIIILIANNFITALTGLIFPTVLYLATKIPALRILFHHSVGESL
ncbi:MAG TPA: hypothetical protein VFE58_02575 [Tepidisphaeraceae bacterium]|jgi:hypothetical protein|nr:hypothetical protein [Tepidisphaeraceae bacterium]